MIVKATISDAEKLTNIALKSKAFWGYTKDQLINWKDDLTIKPKMFDKWEIYKHIVNDEISGFYILNTLDKKSSTLEFLFISPNYIKKGIGSELLKHAIKYCQNNSVTVLCVLSDPNAEGFYTKHGFKFVTKKESDIKGRFLPELVLELSS